MRLQDKIRFLRNRDRMTQKELGKRLGVSTVSVQNWETGARLPSVSAVISLSSVFNVTADYLLGINISEDTDIAPLSRDEAELLDDYRSLDNYGKKAVSILCKLEKTRVAETEAAAKPISISAAVTRYIPKFTIPSAAGYSAPIDSDDHEMVPVTDDIPERTDFIVVIQGDSMEPYIHDGDMAYVEEVYELANGEVGIFNVNGSMYCKQYYRDALGNATLVSANPDLRRSNIQIPADSDISMRCLGRVLLGRHIDLPSYLFE